MAKKEISFLRKRLKYWSKFDFGSIKLKKLSILHDLEMIDATKESRSLTKEERCKDSTLRAEMYSILKQEEIYWKHRTGVTWLKEGYENTSYFHFVANGH